MEKSNVQNFRMEKDSVGELQVPENAYYGVQSLRAKENFKITGKKQDPEIIKSIAEIKKACAISNNMVGVMSDDIKDSIVKACDEIIAGSLHDEFVTDPIQGGAGTSHNMNANEVIANRAIEIMGGKKGDYSIVHPNDHVNFGQSTNDVYPTSGKLAAIRLFLSAKAKLGELICSLEKKAEEFDDFIKMGRTQLQDAVPVRLGQEFSAYANALKRDLKRFDEAIDALSVINMGATAIGTGLNADTKYMDLVVPELSKITGLKLTQSEDLIDGTQNLDVFVYVSGIIKSCAVSLSKMSNDLRLMSSGPRCGLLEINLPAKQNGSSIMPGKVNPVIPEVMSQVSFNIIGNDMAITMAAEAGQLELNAFEPVLFYNLFESLRTLVGGMDTLMVNCINGITADKEKLRKMVDNSVGIITALVPHIGYAEAARVAKESIKTGCSVRKLVLDYNIMSEEKLNRILDVKGMTCPGISAEELMLEQNK